MQIKVTQSDISNGGTEGCDCPVALAMRRKWPNAFVGAVRFKTDGAELTQHDLPHEAVSWITDYDRGLPVTPFTFEVSV